MGKAWSGKKHALLIRINITIFSGRYKRLKKHVHTRRIYSFLMDCYVSELSNAMGYIFNLTGGAAFSHVDSL